MNYGLKITPKRERKETEKRKRGIKIAGLPKRIKMAPPSPVAIQLCNYTKRQTGELIQLRNYTKG